MTTRTETPWSMKVPVAPIRPTSRSNCSGRPDTSIWASTWTEPWRLADATTTVIAWSGLLGSVEDPVVGGTVVPGPLVTAVVLDVDDGGDELLPISRTR